MSTRSLFRLIVVLATVAVVVERHGSRITLPVAMLNYLEFRIDPTLAAVATVQILIVGVLMAVTDHFVKLSRVV